MAHRPWWQRLDGLPWESQLDAQERTRWWVRESSFLSAFLLAQLTLIGIGVAGVLAFRSDLGAALIVLALSIGGTIAAIAWWRS